MTFGFIAFFLIATATSGIVGVIVGHRRAKAAITAFAVVDRENRDVAFTMETMLTTFHDLTSLVGDQVDEYSSKLREIASGVECNADAQTLLSATQLLFAANQQLQSELESAKTEIENQRKALSDSVREARTDALTGLANRRSFDQELTRSVAMHRRKSTPFSLVILDIDHFKRLNDTYGHMIGDQVLKSFARCLKDSFRETDIVCRYGGEEFAVILPQTTLKEALVAAERTRLAIAECRHSIGEQDLQVTASIGVKEITRYKSEVEILTNADRALYAAKQAGRNCCWYFAQNQTLPSDGYLGRSAPSVTAYDRAHTA